MEKTLTLMIKSIEELKSAIERGDIDTVVVGATDMQGRLQGKRIHAPFFIADTLKNGTEGCNYLLAVDIDMNTVQGYEVTSWETGYGDMGMSLDLETVRALPWHEKTAFVTADLVDHHHHDISVSPRAILKKQLARLENAGMVALCGTELEFIVFNDAKEFPDYTNDNDITIKKQITNTCDELGIKCYELFNDNHRYIKDASTRTGITCNIIFEYQKTRYKTTGDNHYLIIDSDMFLIDYFEVDRYMKYGSAVVIQDRDKYKYIWNGIYYMNMERIRNPEKVNWNLSEGTDTGGMMNEWLKAQLEEGEILANGEEIRWNEKNKYNTKNLYLMKHLWSLSWCAEDINNNYLLKFLEKDIRNEVKGDKNYYYCEIYDDKFLHLRNGGNWLRNGINFYKELIKELREEIKSII